MIRHIALIVLLFQAFAPACLWDYDTLIDERRGLPGVAEIIAGRWERHSPEFYRHRIAAMQKLLAGKPDDTAAIDNLAVAYEKIGDIETAIKTALDKETRFPGLYTTAANLGTFYIHDGDLDAGIEQIKKAIAINPDAHFGREKYQLQVAEFLRHPPAADKDGAVGSFVVPMLGLKIASTEPSDITIAERMRIARLGRPGDRRGEIDKAVEGVVGMIRFGTGVSPHLYYALGDLLAARGDPQLAYRAYLRAIEFKHPNEKEVRAAADAMKDHAYGPGDMDAQFAAERQSADKWVTAYQDHERALLAAGRDAEDEKNFADFYAAHGSPREPLPWIDWRKFTAYGKEQLFAGIALIFVVMYVVSRVVASRRKARQITGDTATT